MRAIRVAIALALLLWVSASARGQEPEVPKPEAPPPVLRAVEWHGTDALDPDVLQARIFTQPRPWFRFWEARPAFDPATLEADMQRITDTYRENGRYRAT